MRICIINPPTSLKKKALEEWSNNTIHNFPYLGIRYLESALKQVGIDVDIYDCPCEDISLAELYRNLSNNNYSHIGISVFYYNMMSFERIVSYISKLPMKPFVFIGGYAATLDYEEFLLKHDLIQAVILGDGEDSTVFLMSEFLKRADWHTTPGIAFINRDGKITVNSQHQSDNLDKLPFPSHRLYGYSKTLTIITSRGCYGNCKFCSEKKFNTFNNLSGPARFRTVENVINEISQNYELLNPKFLGICDSNFMPSTLSRKEWLTKFFIQLKSNNIKIDIRVNTRANDILFYKDYIKQFKEGGLNSYFIGIESFVQRQLDLYNKKITVEENIKCLKILMKHNLTFEIGFLIIEPYVSLIEIKENLIILDSLQLYGYLDYNQVFFSIGSTLYSLRGTDIFDKILSDNLESNDEIGYVFLNEDTEKYYHCLRIWSQEISGFTYLQYLVDKALYFSETESKVLILQCINSMREIDVKFMIALVDTYQEDDKVQSLIYKYKKKLEEIHKVYLKTIEQLISLE